MNTTAVISCWWVSGTSLGRPVVPLVCTRMAGSAGRRRSTGRSGGVCRAPSASGCAPARSRTRTGTSRPATARRVSAAQSASVRTAAGPARTWTRDSNGLGRDAGPVGRGLRLVPDVAGLAHDPPPAGELEQDAVRVLEVERAHEHAGVQFPGHAELAVVVVDDRAH